MAIEWTERDSTLITRGTADDTIREGRVLYADGSVAGALFRFRGVAQEVTETDVVVLVDGIEKIVFTESENTEAVDEAGPIRAGSQLRVPRTSVHTIWLKL